jgi:transposase
MERLKGHDLEKIFTEEVWRMNGQYLYNTIGFLKKQIDEIERYVLKKHKDSSFYQGLQTVPGIGEVLGLTIALETGPIERFASEKNYASYCRCVPSAYWSNNKKKGCGNQKNGNKYLSWAFAEAACFCLRHCEAAKKYHQRKVSKTNQPSAYRALANKLAKACYFIMRDGVVFDENKLFGN